MSSPKDYPESLLFLMKNCHNIRGIYTKNISPNVSSDEDCSFNAELEEELTDFDSNVKSKTSSYNTPYGGDVEEAISKRRRCKSRKRSTPLKRCRSDEPIKPYLFGPILRRVRVDSAWFAPLPPVPIRQTGFAWNGVYRRTPIVIFSPTVMMSKDSAVRNITEKFNVTYKLTRTDCRLIRALLQSHGLVETMGLSNDYNLLWSNNHIRLSDFKTLQEFQRVNHFPRSYEITRKDKLAQNVRRMQMLKGIEHFDIIPRTFILPADQAELRSSYLKGQGPFIVKPIASSRGRGIHIICNPDVTSGSEQVIVSKYIANPLLIDGFKFDLRLYVAVTSYSPLVIYIYEEGLVRFATVRYQRGTRHYRNLCMHLTNYSVNKKNRYFVHNDDAEVEDFGNKWSLGALLRYLRSEGRDTAALMLRIEDIIIKAFIAVEDQVNQACRLFMTSKSNCFELYGFDIIVDDTFRPWLLEVNLSPSLACDAPLDFKVKSNMLADLLNLAGVVCCDPSRGGKKGTNAVPGFTSPKHPAYFVPAQSYVRMEGSPKSSRASCPLESEPVPSLAKVHSKLTNPSREMTLEEQKLVRRFQEETARCGGWLRIFPNAQSWPQYASLLFGNSQSEAGETPLPRWRFSMSSTPTHTVANSNSTPKQSTRRADEAFVTQASAALAVAAMQKASSLILESMVSNNLGEITLIHPNLLPAEVNIGLFTGLVNSKSRSVFKEKWESSEEKGDNLLVQVPPLCIEDSQAVLSLHSLSATKLSECLLSGLGLSSPAIGVKKEQYRRVVACYSQTLARLPFYHRKLGALPVRIRGVCLLGGCGHLTNGHRLCGINGTTDTNTSSKEASKSPEGNGDVDQLYRRGKRDLSFKCLTHYQARVTFSAYLSRIYSRFNSSLSESSKKTETAAGLKKAGKQVDLVLRFLEKAALRLSPQSVKWFYNENSCDPSVQRLFKCGVFQVPSFPEHARLTTKKRLLVSLLDKFLQIYNHETATSCGDAAGEDANFRRFIDTASEVELETLLSKYTHNFNSLSLFTPSKVEKSEETVTKLRPPTMPTRSRSSSEQAKLQRVFSTRVKASEMFTTCANNVCNGGSASNWWQGRMDSAVDRDGLFGFLVCEDAGSVDEENMSSQQVDEI